MIPFFKNTYKLSEEESAKLKKQQENEKKIKCCCCGVEHYESEYSYCFYSKEICVECFNKIRDELAKRNSFTEVDAQEIFEQIRKKSGN